MSTTLTTRPKSFLTRPEGKVGLVVSTGAVLGAAYALYRVLPVLITLVANLLTLALLCGAAGLLIYLVADGRVRAFAAYVYKSFFRLFTGFFIELDPIGILRHHIAELGSKLEMMRDKLGNLSGQIRRVERLMAENVELRDHALALAESGRRDAAHADASRLQARHAVKLEDSNARLGAMKAQLETLFRMLKRLSDTSELVLEDMRNTVDIKTRERNGMKAAYSAYRGALAILRGQSEGRELYDRAMEFLNDDYARKLGEIELFMDFSEGVMRAADLERLSYDARASERLDAWERRLSETLADGSSSARAANVTAGHPSASSDPLELLLDAPKPNRSRFH